MSPTHSSVQAIRAAEAAEEIPPDASSSPEDRNNVLFSAEHRVLARIATLQLEARVLFARDKVQLRWWQW